MTVMRIPASTAEDRPDAEMQDAGWDFGAWGRLGELPVLQGETIADERPSWATNYRVDL